MTTLTVAADVSAAFGEAHIVAVTVDGLENGSASTEIEQRLAALERAGSSVDESDPRIASWHAAYRRFGTNPRRQRPSVDALTRRLARTGRLPRINLLVDAYNLVSVTHVVPAGAFDLDAVEGDVVVRFARPGDTFTPLGEPDAVEQPHDREVVYADARGVLTRHWNHRDADRTKITPASRHVVVLLEAIAAEQHAAVDAAAAELAALLAPHAKSVQVDVVR